ADAFRLLPIPAHVARSMSPRAGIGPCPKFRGQDREPPARRLFAARGDFFAMNAAARPHDGRGSIDLGREAAFALGPLWIHPATCEVEAGESRETVQPRAMQVLVALARTKGAVVSRHQLLDIRWER